ncbi:MAG: type II toxin-antitoxin system HicA family toxin [Candidatus Sulfotelmatobacter sp.]
MSQWPSTKARIVYRALLKIGWKHVGQVGSHKKLGHPKFADSYTWAFGPSDELGPKMLARIAKKTGLKPSDL